LYQLSFVVFQNVENQISYVLERKGGTNFCKKKRK